MTNETNARSRDDWIRFAFTLGFNGPFWALLLWAILAIDKTEVMQGDGAALTIALAIGVSMIWASSFAGGIIAAARKGAFDSPADGSRALHR